MEVIDCEGGDVECAGTIRDTQQGEEGRKQGCSDEIELTNLVDVSRFDARRLDRRSSVRGNAQISVRLTAVSKNWNATSQANKKVEIFPKTHQSQLHPY